MVKLSLCIATFNEEKFIHYPLDSAYEIADEVIIVDGGSEDKTVEIAKSYGPKVKVYSVDNPTMFHINKQKALDHATGDWILQLDADEALSPELKDEILAVLGSTLPVVSSSDKPTTYSQQSTTISAYWIPRKNWFLTKFLEKGGIYPDATIRLYKKGSARFPCKNVHENVKVKGNVGALHNDLLHYADPTFERYLSRWNRYTTLDAKELAEKKQELCGLCYFVTKPLSTFLSIYFRHKGFQDGFAGFVWALFSSIRWWVIYVKAQTLSPRH